MRSWDCSQIENEEEEDSWGEGDHTAAQWAEEQHMEEILERRGREDGGEEESEVNSLKKWLKASSKRSVCMTVSRRPYKETRGKVSCEAAMEVMQNAPELGFLKLENGKGPRVSSLNF